MIDLVDLSNFDLMMMAVVGILVLKLDSKLNLILEMTHFVDCFGYFA